MNYRFAAAAGFLIILSAHVYGMPADENALYSAYIRGDDIGFVQAASSFVKTNPAAEETYLYMEDLFNASDYAGYRMVADALSNVLEYCEAAEGIDAEYLKRRAVTFKDDLDFRYRKGDGSGFSRSYSPVTRWHVSVPFKKFGKGDLSCRFTPEFNFLKYHISDSHAVQVKERSGKCHPDRFLSSSGGIAYFTSAVSMNDTAILRIESDADYVLFINGKEYGRNDKRSTFRNARSFHLSGFRSVLIGIKTEYRKGSFFRVTMMDGGGKPLVPGYNAIPAFDEGSCEEFKEPHHEKLLRRYEQRKDAESAFKIGLSLSSYDDIEALRWYEKSLSLHSSLFMQTVYASECIRLGAMYGFVSLEEKGTAQFDEVLKAASDAAPAVLNRLHRTFKYEDHESSGREAYKRCRNGANYDMMYECCRFFESAGNDILRRETADIFIKKFPNSIEAKISAARIDESSFPDKSIAAYKDILSAVRDEETAARVARLMKQCGDYTGSIYLQEFIDDETKDAAFLSAEIMTDGKEYSNAKKILLRAAAQKDDVRVYELLGRIEYMTGGRPEMYWEKVSALEPGERFPRDYIEKENGRCFNPLLEKYREKDNVDRLIRNFSGGGRIESKVLYRAAVQKIYSDREGRFLSEELISVQTAEDAERYGEYRIPFSSNFFPVQFRVYSPDGSYTESFSVKESGGALYVTIEGLSPGTLLHAVYEIDMYSPLLRDSAVINSGLLFMQEYEEPVDEYIAAVIVPSNIKLQVHASSGAAVTSADMDDETIWQIRCRSLPTIKPESFSPSPEKLLVWYSYTDGTDDDFFEWYKTRFPDERFSSLPDVKEETDRKKMEAVYAYVSRRMTLDGTLYFDPYNPSDCLASGKGTAEDKVFCAKALLAAAGIRSYPALVLHKDSQTRPVSTDSFSSVLLYIPDADGSSVWLDFSDTFYPAGTVSPEAENSRAFIIKEDAASSIVVRTDVKTSEKTESSVMIGKSGEAHVKILASFTGRRASLMKYFNDSRMAEEAAGILTDSFGTSAVLKELVSVQHDAVSQVACVAEIPGYAVNSSSSVSFRPFIKELPVTDYLAGETRTMPLYIRESINTEDIFSITLPDGFGSEEYSFVKTVSFERGIVRYSITKSKGSGAVDVRRSVYFPESVIEPERYGDFVKFCTQLRSIEKMRLIFARD